jgi:phage terminase large subunit-like protein
VTADRVVADGEYIALGFDGSISQDATALVGCTPDGHLFEIEIWERPVNAPAGWKIPRLEVERKVEETFERFTVGRMFCDPPKWQTEIERWMERWNAGRKAEDAIVAFFDTNQPRRMSPACDRFATSVNLGAVTHDGSSLLTSHVLAMAKAKAKARDPEGDGRTLYVFTKGDDGRKIDGGIAAVLALEAAMTMPEQKTAHILVAWR